MSNTSLIQESGLSETLRSLVTSDVSHFCRQSCFKIIFKISLFLPLSKAKALSGRKGRGDVLKGRPEGGVSCSDTQSRRCTHTHTGVCQSCTNNVCFGFNTSDGTASRSFTPRASADQLATGHRHAGEQVLPKRRGRTSQRPLAEPHTHCHPSLPTAILQAT